MASDQFLIQGNAMSQRLGLHWPHLLKVMNLESGILPSARNPSGAYGLIQIRNLPGVGWTEGPDAFLALSDVAQLPYVERFLNSWSRFNLHSVGRIHQALYVPATLTLPQFFPDSPSTVITASSGDALPEGISPGLRSALVAAYRANTGFDKNQDGRITVAELELTDDQAAARPNSPYQRAIARLRTLLPGVVEQGESRVPRDKNVASTFLGLAALGAAAYLVYPYLSRGLRLPAPRRARTT